MPMKYMIVQSLCCPLIFINAGESLVEVALANMTEKLICLKAQDCLPMTNGFMANSPDKASLLAQFPSITVNPSRLVAVVNIDN
jgi:hypothetical protein